MKLRYSLNWPGNWPNLNPIEILYDLLRNKLVQGEHLINKCVLPKNLLNRKNKYVVRRV